MATDVSKSGSSLKITVDSGQPRHYVTQNAEYFFNSAGTILNIKLGRQGFSIPLTDLRIQGAGSAPVSAAAAYTALVTNVFP